MLITPQAEAQSTTLLVTVPHGSRHETDQQAGLAHFFEHLVFKGAKKYPTPEAIAQALDNYGAEYNAFTDFEQTAYYAKIATSHFDVALDVIADYLQYPKLQTEDIERERGVILEEYNMYWDVPEHRADMQINPIIFGPTPLGRTIIGTKETIKALRREDLVAWREAMYGADRVVISVAGQIPNNLEQQIDQSFQDLPAPQKVKLVPPQNLQTGPKFLMDTRPAEQIQLVMAFEALKANHPLNLTQRVLRVLMGASMSSRLFTEIREKRGLCYSIRMEDQAFSDTGIILVSAGLDQSKIDQAVQAIWEELKKIATQPPPVAELTRAKEFIKGATTLSLEDSAAVARLTASQLLFEGKVTPVEERFAQIDAVTAKAVTQLASELFQAKKLGMVMVGPEQDITKLRQIFVPSLN